MDTNQTAQILIEFQKQQSLFYPPYCPYSKCKNHKAARSGFFARNGAQYTAKFPYLNQRYICLDCGKQFSYSTFHLDFRKKMPGLCEEIFSCKTNGMSNLSIARKLKISEATVRLRLSLMKRQALIKKKKLETGLKISEAVVYDGFETFTYSQFDPCYVNTAVGKKSLFTYEINFAPLNRKGRMTNEQKIKNEQLCARFGRYPSAAIQTQTTYTLKKLLKQCPGNLLLYSDEHQSYQRSIRRDLTDHKIEHHLTNSQVSRNGKNPLFAVNHLHLWYRHFLSSQKRETIAFNKNEAGLMDTIFLQTICKNYLSPQMYKRTPYNKLRNQQSPAMSVGLTNKILTFDEFFDSRRMASQVDFDEQERKFYRSEYLFQRRKICQYSGP